MAEGADVSVRPTRGKRGRHASYLLRLWQAEDNGRIIWRASLQSPDTGERLGFATLADLLGFLKEEYGPVDRPKMDSQEDTV